jgi:uncharacterized RDD family membrane protein YckC
MSESTETTESNTVRQTGPDRPSDPEPSPADGGEFDPPIIEEVDRGAALAELATAAGTATGSRPLQPVGIGRRAGAVLVDAFVLLFVLTLVGICSGMVAGRSALNRWLDVVMPLLFLSVIACHLAVEALGGRTLGRLLTDSRATRLDGGPPSLGQRLARTGMRNLPAVVAGGWVALLGFVHLVAPDGPLAQWLAGRSEHAGTAVGGSLLVMIASGLCAAFPPYLALHDRIAGMAVYDEADLVRHRRRPGGGPTGGFDVIPVADR